jgi:hypothetical protein
MALVITRMAFDGIGAHESITIGMSAYPDRCNFKHLTVVRRFMKTLIATSIG